MQVIDGTNTSLSSMSLIFIISRECLRADDIDMLCLVWSYDNPEVEKLRRNQRLGAIKCPPEVTR